MSIKLEHVNQHDGTVDADLTQRNFDRLAGLVPDLGGQSVSIRFGITSVVFSAASYSSVTNVTHGLGRVPQVIVATPYYDDVSGLTQDVYVTVTNLWTDTDFRLSAQADSGTGAKTGTLKVCWIAIG